MSFPNEARGLKIKGTSFVYLSEGAYGIVFVDRDQKRIRKVYRERKQKEHAAMVFRAETEAYEIASKDDSLKDLVPQYFGICCVPAVVDAKCNDVSSEFYCDLSFEAEFVECPFHKSVVLSKAECVRIFTLFRNSGIEHVSDVSVCVADGIATKVIDFATQEIEPMHDDA